MSREYVDEPDREWNIFYRSSEWGSWVPEFRSPNTYEYMIHKMLQILRTYNDNPRMFQYQWLMKNVRTGEVIPGELFV